MNQDTARRADDKSKSGAAFPGGNVGPLPGELRIAIEKKPYAAIIGHAVVEPDVEVCGVLVGRVGHDAHGDFLHITDVIRGKAAKQEGAQVTFTHETWNHIHQEMDRHHADEEIVGWYHTHGGFGIFLSEMDQFIHNNFFSAPHHVAYVFDPLAGSEGFFVKRGEALEPLPRYWLAGRERKVLARRNPEEATASTGSAGTPANADLAAVTSALRQTAAALQAHAAGASGSEGGFGAVFPWVLALGLAGLLGWQLITGQALFGAGAGAPRARQGAMLIVERDARSGAATGIELTRVHQQQQDRPVFADREGNLFIGFDAAALAEANPTIKGLLAPTQPAPAAPGTSAAAAAPPATPEPAATPDGFVLPRGLGVAAIAGLIVVGAAAGWLVARARRAGGREVRPS